MDALPSREKSIQETLDHKPGSLLTIHELSHILDEPMDNSECLSCCGSNLVLCQPVKPPQDCLDVLLLEKLLHKFDCVVLSRVKKT